MLLKALTSFDKVLIAKKKKLKIKKNIYLFKYFMICIILYIFNFKWMGRGHLINLLDKIK